MKDWIYNAREYFNNGIDAKYLGAREDKFREAIEKFSPMANAKQEQTLHTMHTYINNVTKEISTFVDGLPIEIIEIMLENKKEMKRKYDEIMSK